MNEQRAIQVLTDIRKPLLALHKAILEHERASYEKEFGPITPGSFLQILLNRTGFRWIAPLSTLIANIDEVLDDQQGTADDRLASAQAAIGLFSADKPNSVFLQRYLPLLQTSPSILHEHGRVAQVLRSADT